MGGGERCYFPTLGRPLPRYLDPTRIGPTRDGLGDEHGTALGVSLAAPDGCDAILGQNPHNALAQFAWRRFSFALRRNIGLLGNVASVAPK